jgi:ferredoxin
MKYCLIFMRQFVIRFSNKDIIIDEGANLRKALLSHGQSPYNGLSAYLNCRGMGSCGTCAVRIKGHLNPPTFMEKWRLGFPPHRKSNGLRLACQVKVKSDLIIEKGKGFWGEKIDQY